MLPESILSILTFPQLWQNNQLTIRALVIPRNIDPTKPTPTAPPTDAWVNATIALEARLIADPEKYPSMVEAFTVLPMNGIAMPPNVGDILTEIATQLGGVNVSTTLEKPAPTHRARKYLPESYRNSFNFVAPRTKDAAIDDAYHCAIKDTVDLADPFPTPRTLSWGKVFAFCLRQPVLAERVGFVYEATIDVDPELVKNGGWLYIDTIGHCSYTDAKTGSPAYVKRFAAKLPKLKAGEDRALFAAIQFPVLLDPAIVVPDDTDPEIPIAPYNMDELQIEAAQYDDGFCKIVHANQPISSDLLREKEDKELPVITEAGIRLAWDDEQLLIWMNRQIAKDENVKTGGRNIAPMGVMQYRVDVRLHSDDNNNLNPWMPLCRVKNNADLMIGANTIDTADAEKELGVEVYPAQIDQRKDQPFWLPQYYANWIGKSLVLPDVDAIHIFQKENNKIIEKQSSNFKLYSAAGLDNFQLTYGNKYDFRVRLADISGGGPAIDRSRKYAAAAPEAFCDFRRWVQPQTVRLLEQLPERDDAFFTGNELNMRRPLLGYPAVLFTGKYPNGVNELMADAEDAKLNKRELGLADPDVEFVEVLVEVKALEMDMLLRHNTDSRESYAKLYITQRRFDDPFESVLNIPLTFVDAPVLTFTDSTDLGILGLVAGGDDVNLHTDIVLPKSRNIRITLRPVVRNVAEYYARDSNLPKKGKPVVIVTRRAGEEETALFKPTADVDRIRGVWLQPDTDTYLRASLGEIFVENNRLTNTSSMMDRLADAIDKSIDVEAKGLSLLGKPGIRVQFGASRFIRHNMSPDSTNITFSTKADLLNHWIIPITLLLNRDWTWDNTLPVSFEVWREKKMVGAGLSEAARDAIAWSIPPELVGDIEMKHTINIQALYNPDRSHTQLCFIDAVEPKTEDPAALPEEIMVRYTFKARFKPEIDGVIVNRDEDTVVQLHLPITTKPAQVPKIVGAGLAQSKYVNDELYSSTEPRRRYLWLEFAEPLLNPNDAYFIRMLAYSPDPLLAQWESDMFKAPEEPTLAINPEPVRIIAPGHTDDKSGLTAMQELTKADDSNVHYLVALPPGLHAASAELFGFFTYELRVGHKIGWCTAQARFGSVLRTTGVQHPLPQLFAAVNRNEKHIMVTAPFAQTVFNGADVTSKPPRTQLWALLYAQVKRADDEVYRNILLDDQLFVRQRISVNPATGQQIIDTNTDAIQYGITGWKNNDVNMMLQQYGLPIDSSLSVLVVEMLPTYDKFVSPFQRGNNLAVNNKAELRSNALMNFQEGMQVEYFKAAVNYTAVAAGIKQQQLEDNLQNRMEEAYINQAQKEEMLRPLTEQLGSERILRTSTLVPVPPICCTE